MRQFLTATEQEIRQMISCLDAYPYTDGQLFMYLTWVMSKEAEVPPRVVLLNMEFTGKSNVKEMQ